MFDLKKGESICHACKSCFRDDEGEYCVVESPNIGTEDGCFMFDRIPDPDEEKEDDYEEPDIIFMAVTL